MLIKYTDRKDVVPCDIFLYILIEIVDVVVRAQKASEGSYAF